VSYLLQYARRPRSIATRSTQVRVDENIRLNRPGLYGFAERRDNSRRRGGAR
jgi:hypothetical protein